MARIGLTVEFSASLWARSLKYVPVMIPGWSDELNPLSPLEVVRQYGISTVKYVERTSSRAYQARHDSLRQTASGETHVPFSSLNPLSIVFPLQDSYHRPRTVAVPSRSYFLFRLPSSSGAS